MGDQRLVALGDKQVIFAVPETQLFYLAFVPDVLLLLKIIIDICNLE